MFCVYVLQSKKERHWYTGSTSDLKRSLKDHNNGKIPATKELYEFSRGGITAETRGILNSWYEVYEAF